jgi:hypothetical protein
LEESQVVVTEEECDEPELDIDEETEMTNVCSLVLVYMEQYHLNC